MLTQLRTRIQNLPFSDETIRRQAATFQVMLVVILGGCLFGMALTLLSSGYGNRSHFVLGIYLSIIACTGGSVVLLHRSRFTAAVLVAVTGITSAIGASLLGTGLAGGGMTMLALGIMVVLAGLLLGRIGIGYSASLCMLFVVAAGLLEGTPLVGFSPPRPQSAATIIPTFGMLLVILSLFLDRFGNALRRALGESQARGHELEALHAQLEAKVAERTVELQASLDELRASQAMVHALSVPILPVLSGVLVAPVIGTIDTARAEHLTDRLLRAVERERARAVILDVTAIPAVEASVVHALMRTTAALRLLGAEPYLVGVRAEVASMLVSLDVTLDSIHIYPDLAEAVSFLSERRQ
jgi:anti-anti-sigma regulatory factor